MAKSKDDPNAESVDSITINYEEDGVLLVKELKKEILSRGAWTTIIFLFQEFDRGSKTYRTPKISLRRYQKRGGSFIQRSKFTISSQKQAMQVSDKLKEWCLSGQLGGADAAEDDGA